MQTGQYAAKVGSRLKRVEARKAPSEKPAFQPYRGKPAVRKCVQLKTGVFSRRQTCRGKSQEPRSSGGRVAGDQNPEAPEKVSLGEATSCRAVTTVNVLWPRKV